jgi:Mrp family chromosome partitioning ATPase
MAPLIGLTSGRSSPGVSSLAVGLGWAFARRSIDSLVIEADAAGGVVGQRFGLPPWPSALSLVREASESLTDEVLARHAIEHRRVRYILAPVDPASAGASLERLGHLFARGGYRPPVPTLVDLGRWSTAIQWGQMARVVDSMLVVTTPRLEDVQAARFALAYCNDLGTRAGVVVVGDRPFAPTEVAEALEAPLAGAIVHDPATAAALGGGTFSAGPYRRSLLGRSIEALASNVLVSVR